MSFCSRASGNFDGHPNFQGAISETTPAGAGALLAYKLRQKLHLRGVAPDPVGGQDHNIVVDLLKPLDH